MSKENLVVDYKQDYKKSWELAVTELFNKDKRIEELQKELKNKPDAKYTLTTADGKEFTIIQSERIDMQQELNNTILDLKQRIDKAQSIIRYYFTDGFEDVYDMLNNISDALNEENKKTWKEIVGIEYE